MVGSGTESSESAPLLRVVVLSGLAPAVILRLVDRLRRDAPHVRVAGVLIEETPPKPLARRARDFVRNIFKPGEQAYLLSRVAGEVRAVADRQLHRLIRAFHAAPPAPDAQAVQTTAEALSRLRAYGIDGLVVSNMHTPEAHEFVRGLGADLGIVFGTRILRPSLYEIPRFGSINIHKRKVPDYRGGGPIGLWELLDDQPEIGITVHRVAAKVDTGDIVRETTIPIEPFDDLTSLELKADLVGDDLIVQAAEDYALGRVQARPQPTGGRTFKTPSPAALRRHARTIAARRPAFRPVRGRPRWKLALRLCLWGVSAWRRNRRFRSTASFPIVMLYHHVISDRPHSMGMSTSHFARQMRYLAAHYRVVSLPEALEMARSGRVTEPTVVLTFDDGYADNVLNVRAVLEPLGMTATFFVCSEHLTTGAPFEHDLRANDPGFRPMTWDDARLLSRLGFTIGSHTRTHFNCGSSDAGRLEQEIAGARVDIEAELGSSVPWFSFPWGRPANMSATAVDIAKRTYDYVFSACGGVNAPRQAPPQWHFLRCPHPDDLLELELTLQSMLETTPESAQLPF